MRSLFELLDSGSRNAEQGRDLSQAHGPAEFGYGCGGDLAAFDGEGLSFGCRGHCCSCPGDWVGDGADRGGSSHALTVQTPLTIAQGGYTVLDMNTTSSSASFTSSTGVFPMSALTPAMRRAITSAFAEDNFNGYLRCSRRTGQALIAMGLAEATPLKYERLTLAGQNLYCDRL